MKLYIAQKGDTLESISTKFGVTFSDLKTFNKTYLNRVDLESCPVLIPEEKENMREALPFKVIKSNKESKISPLNTHLFSWFFYLKEAVICEYFAPDYTDFLTPKMKKEEQEIVRIIGQKSSVFGTIKEDSKALSDNVIFLVKSIKNHGLEDVKKRLINIKNWGTEIYNLYPDSLRNNSLKTVLESVSNLWRDYVINVGEKHFKDAESCFENIIKNIPDLAFKFINKESLD